MHNQTKIHPCEKAEEQPPKLNTTYLFGKAEAASRLLTGQQVRPAR